MAIQVIWCLLEKIFNYYKGDAYFMQIRVGIVGAGSMGMNHLRVLSDFNEDQIRIVGVAETYEPNLKRATSRFHVRGYTDYRQMIEENKPDLVAIVVPSQLHLEVASYVLDRGI